MLGIFKNAPQKEVWEFLKKSLPAKVDTLEFGGLLALELVPFQKYSFDFCKILPRVTNKVTIWKFNLSKKHLRCVFHSICNLNIVAFCECHLDTEGVRFNPKHQFKIRRIEFSICGKYSPDGKEGHQRRFEYLIDAFKQWKLRHSLKKIHLVFDLLTKKEVIQILKRKKLKDIRVSDLEF